MKNITDCEREMYEQKSAGSPILCSIYEESCFVHCIVAQTEKKKTFSFNSCDIPFNSFVNHLDRLYNKLSKGFSEKQVNESEK
jgi:hypothetical protein